MSALQDRVTELEMTLAAVVRIIVQAYEAEGMPVPPVLRAYQATHAAAGIKPTVGPASRIRAGPAAATTRKPPAGSPLSPLTGRAHAPLATAGGALRY